MSGSSNDARLRDEFLRELRGAAVNEIPAWLGSMILHMLLIIGLGTLFMQPPPQPVVPTLEATVEIIEVKPLPLEVKKQEFLLKPSELPNVGSVRTAGVDVEVSTAMHVAEAIELPRRPPEVQHVTELKVPLLQDLVSAPTQSNRTGIKGVAGDGATGTLGALDRITQEILASLERGPTLVVWFFDQSGSMQIQRDAVASRFDNVYKELGLSKAIAPKGPNDQPLLSAVVSFGKDISFVVDKPTDDLELIRSAVASIQNDDSGIEMTFTAVGAAAQKFERYRFSQPRRRVMMVVFTDEVGEDENRLEDVITVCKRNQMPVYVAGVPAPFGRPNIEIKYVDPDPNYDQSVQWIPVRQGPETFMSEQVQLNFSGSPNREDGIYRLDSGFGPYCLTRLCYETGGIFFAVHGNRERVGEHITARETPVFQARLNHFFDPLVMKPYRPDYLPLQDYIRSVQKNKAKLALLETAKQSTVEPMSDPMLVFRKTGEDDSSMKAALDEAQKKAAILQPRINNLYALIKEGEKDREKLTEPRWRAGFDLAYGRIMAVKVRTEFYNAMLARAKGGMKFADPKTNVLTLVPANEVTNNSQLDKMAKLSRELLERVAQEHRGTPWAMLAEAELKDPIGWRWQESYDPPPPPPSARPQPPPVNNVARPNNNPPQFRRETPKPMRQNVKL
jgi:hypothetical protein